MSVSLETKPLLIDPAETARRLGISEHELKALVDAKKILGVWISPQTAMFAATVVGSLEIQANDIPKVKWRKPPSPDDHAEDPFDRRRYARTRYAGSLASWRKLVLGRDDHRCRRCKCDDPRVLTAHHLKPRNRYPGLALDVENGITLCANCHRIEHLVKPVQNRKWSRRNKEKTRS